MAVSRGFPGNSLPLRLPASTQPEGRHSGNDITRQMFLVLHALLDRAGPGKTERVDKAKVSEILHAAVEFVLVKCHIRHIICGIRFQLTALVLLPAVTSKVCLINVITLFLPAVRHAAEHARHLRMVRLVPPLTKGKMPVRIAKPENGVPSAYVRYFPDGCTFRNPCR